MSVVLVLFNVPLTKTVPPIRLNVPSWARVKLPPRLMDELLAVRVPLLVHVPVRLSVELTIVICPDEASPPLTVSDPAWFKRIPVLLKGIER